MGDFKRKADGRRIFDVEFKRATAARIAAGETTIAQVARELDIQPALIRRWIKLAEGGSVAAVESGEEVVPVSRVRELERQVRDLQRIIGKQAVTIEILEAARDIVKIVRTCSKDPSVDRQADRGHLPGPACGSCNGVSPASASIPGLLPAS